MTYPQDNTLIWKY